VAILFDTDTVAPSERFDFWTDSSDRAFFPCTFRRRDTLGFHGTVRQYLMGPLTISRVTSSATSVSRTWSDIGCHDPEAVHLSLQLRGCTVFSQHDRATAVAAGEMVLYDTSHPFSIVTDEPYDLVVLECSRLLLGLRGNDPVSHFAAPLRGDVAHTLVAPFLTRLAHGLADGTVREGDTDLGESAVYLLRALCGDMGAVPDVGRRPPAGDLLARVKVHIEERLGDPGLRPDAIAAAHYVSTRHLQKLFKADGVTVTDWIRQRRMAGCRRDLRDAAHAGETILTIATRWGLSNPAHFSRSFRAEFGCTPSEFRAMDGASAARVI
jgi:AraC-like DNA-binding protein